MMSIEKLNEIKDRAKPELLKRLELEDNTIITDDEIKLKTSFITAAAVSSHEDSIPNTNIFTPNLISTL